MKKKLTPKQIELLTAASNKEAQLYAQFEEVQKAFTESTNEKQRLIDLVADAHGLNLADYEYTYLLDTEGYMNLTEKKKTFTEQVNAAKKKRK